jgi:cation:H+ antiporter
LIQFTAITALALRLKFKSALSSFGFGFENFLIFGLYLLYLRGEKEAEIGQRRDLRSPLTSWIYFGICLIGISVFGRLLIKEANIIVENTRLNYVFFGTLFFALVTSLPELTVTISALLHGSSSMAIGNILGSNAMDISILPLLDLVTRKMPILGLISGMNLFTLVTVEFVTLGLFGIMKVKKEFLKAYEVLLVLLLLIPLFILY